MKIVLEIKGGKHEEIIIDDDVFKMLKEYSIAKGISIEKAIEIICLEYAKGFESEDF